MVKKALAIRTIFAILRVVIPINLSGKLENNSVLQFLNFVNNS